MMRIIDLALKDLRQILRNRMTFLFLLIMPIAFTFLFGLAFGGSYTKGDPRLPVGYLDQDGGSIAQGLKSLLTASTVIRLEEKPQGTEADLETLVGKGDLAGAVIVPNGYSQALQAGTALKLIIIVDPAATSSTTVQADILSATNRLMSAVSTAQIVEKTRNDPAAFIPAFDAAMTAWQQPPIQVAITTSDAIKTQDPKVLSMAHSSPSMMLQFAIAGLLTAGTVIVNERKTRSLQRLLTTATSRVQILMGHYLAIFIMIFIQFILLIGFGQLVLKVDYMRLPLATLLISFATAMCIAALGLLIGILSKSEEQVIIFALIPMFVLSGLGGAWVPLEVTGATFQAVGHMSPVAWSLDGYANIITRGLSINSILLPAAALLGYAILFFFLAAWRFRRSEES